MYLKKTAPFNFIVFILTVLIILSGCSPQTEDPSENKDNRPVVETAFLMGTMVKITIYDEVVDKEVLQKVFERISEIEDRMTINEKTGKSEIIRLNDSAGETYSKLSPDTFYVLKKGKYYSELSGGLFDITIGPLVKLWNIGNEKAAVPGETEINQKLSLVNYKNLILDEKNLSAQLNKQGMIVDLGGIAKGYAADEAADFLEEAGIEHAIVNLGGNILALNKKPDGSKWRLGLQDPYQPRGDYMGIVKLDDQSLVSSGTYERYFEVDGKRYHHILNPQTGYPEENSLVSISIITEESIDADALSTTTFLLGLEKGMEMIEGLEDTEAIFITDDKKVYISSGINKDTFEITKDEFQLQKDFE